MDFQRLGFLPAAQELLLRGDASFGWRHRAQVFRTTPHLRLALIAFLPLHLLLGSASAGEGRAMALDPRARLGGIGNTFYFNGLLMELLEMLREGEPPSPEESAMEASMLAEFESDYLEYPQGDGMVKAWGYFPLKHHRFDPGKPLLRLLFQWGADAADLDSSSMVLCRLIKSRSMSVTGPEILLLLEEHVHGEGRFGNQPLAYGNGVEGRDRGILLWVQEKHNELDAGVNLNLACLIAALLPTLDPPERTRAFRLSAGVFRFLGDHIDRGSYRRKGFLMYYSLEALAFLWVRLSGCLEAMAPEERDLFDPRGDCDRLGRHLAGLLESEAEGSSASFNTFDRFLALPILLRHRARIPSGWLHPAAMRSSIETLSGTAFEFGKFVYPTKLVYGCRAIGLCAVMATLREMARHEALQEHAG